MPLAKNNHYTNEYILIWHFPLTPVQTIELFLNKIVGKKAMRHFYLNYYTTLSW